MTPDPIHITVVTEDELCESVVRAVLAQEAPHVQPAHVLRRGGSGYVKRIIGGINKAARGSAYLALVDLDRNRCASGLISEWLEGQPCHANLLFRIAVTEVDAWLFADRDSFASFLGVDAIKSRIPNDADAIPDPKQTLISLCKHSKTRCIREAFLPQPGSTARVGPGYNRKLGEFVRKFWHVSTALNHSKSLARAVQRVRAFRFTPQSVP
jgi:hypothetical protein